MEGEEEGGALRSRSFYLGEQNRNICHSSLTRVSNEKTQQASSENMSTFQLRASECLDNVVIRG